VPLNSIYEMCQLPIGPRKKPRIPSEEKETLSCRTAAALSPSRPKAAFVPAANGLQSCRRERSAQSKRERNRKIAVMVTTRFTPIRNPEDDGAMKSPVLARAPNR